MWKRSCVGRPPGRNSNSGASKMRRGNANHHVASFDHLLYTVDWGVRLKMIPDKLGWTAYAKRKVKGRRKDKGKGKGKGKYVFGSRGS